MKNSIKKIMAGVSAVAMIAAMPVAGVFAADTTEATFSVREVSADSVSITGYSDNNADKIVIPSEIDGKKVVGVDDFAFGLVSKEVTIVVPETLEKDNIGCEAFFTAAIANKEIVAVSGATTVNGVVKYWINDVAGMNYTDAQIADAVTRAYAHIGEAPVGATVAETALEVLKEIVAGNCGFSQANLDRLDMVFALCPYTLVTLEGPDGTDAQAYAASKIDLKYVVASAYLKGDFNLDGKVNMVDAIAISKYVMGSIKDPSADQLKAGDYNEDGKVNIIDAIQIVKTLM